MKIAPPVVIIAEERTPLPFDVSDQRTLFFRNDMAGVHELSALLPPAIEAALNDTKPDNPIYRAVKHIAIQESATETDATKFLARKLEIIEEQLSQLARPKQNAGSATVTSRNYELSLEADSEEINKFVDSISEIEGVELMSARQYSDELIVQIQSNKTIVRFLDALAVKHKVRGRVHIQHTGVRRELGKPGQESSK